MSTPEELRSARRLREQLELVRATPEMAELLDRYAQTWPTMTAQAAVGLTMQGIDPESEMAVQIAEHEGLDLLEHTRDHKGLFSRIVDWDPFGAAEAIEGTGVPGKMRDVAGTAGMGAKAAGFHLAGQMTGNTGDALAGAAKVGTRLGFTLFESVLDEYVRRPLRGLAYASDQASDNEGEFFNAGEFFGSLPEGQRLAGDSTGRVLHEQFSRNPMEVGKSLLTGGEDTLGAGILPAGDVTQEHERQRSQIHIGGGGADFGDLAMTGMGFDPTSPEHEMWSGILQMGFDVGADPLGGVVATATKVKKAGQLLGETKNLGFGMHVGNRLDDSGALRLGLVRGERNTVLPEVVSAYTRSKGFDPIANVILDPSKTNYDIFQALAGKLSPSQIRALRLGDDGVSMANRDELASRVDDLILGKPGVAAAEGVEGSLPLAPALSPSKVKLRPVKEQSRWASTLPTDAINPELGPANAATQLDRYLIAAKVDRAERARIIDRLGDFPSLTDPVGRAGLKNVMEDAAGAVETALVNQGADPELAKVLTNLRGLVDEDTKYLVDTLAEDPLKADAHRRVFIDGAAQENDFRLVSEVAREYPLPNIREISKEMTGGAMNSKLFKTAYEAELAVSQTVLKAWVPAQLLRGAWTVRVVGEEQVRMAVSGMDSMFKHPASFIAWAIGRKGADDATGAAFKATDETGQIIDVAVDEVQARDMSAWFKSDAGKVASGNYVVTEPGQTDHWSNVVHGLRMQHQNAVSRMVARGDSTDDIVRALMGGADEAPTRALNDIAATMDPATAQRFVNDPGAVRAYIDGFIRPGLSQSTGGNADLLNLVANGSLDGISFKKAAQIGTDRSRLARKVRAVLGDDNAPAYAAGPKTMGAKHKSNLDKLIDLGMTTLMGKPTNYLSRNPAFRQTYWDRTRQLIGGATTEVQDEIIRNAAETFGARSKEMRGLVKAARSGAGETITDIRQLDTAAKAHALEFTKNLLYDQARRTQWVDLTRGIFVFAEAWKEIATTWGRLVSQQPNVARRAGQGVEGLRDAGVFYTDPSSGEEMFTYPAGGWAAKLLGAVGVGASAVSPMGEDMSAVPFETDPEFGEPGIRMTAPVSGLNLFAGSVMPGVGPVVSVAAAKMIPDIPEAAWLKEALFPFGSDKESGSLGDVVESGLPSYMVKLIQGWGGGEMDRDQYGNARWDVIRALTMHDPERYSGLEGQDLAWEDSKELTNNIFAIRGASQLLGAPAAPRVEYFVRDMSGEAFNFAALIKAYRELRNEHGGDDAEATRAFIERFGVSPDLLRQGKTRSVNKRAVTEPGATWELQHPEQVEEHGPVIGFFAPEDIDEDAQLDSEAFDRAIANGDREQLTPDVMFKLANQRTGWIAYDHAVRTMEDAGLEGAALAEGKRRIRDVLKEEYPGFGEEAPVKARLSPRNAIPKLKAALEDPVLAATPQGEAMVSYFGMRDRFLEAAERQFGVTTLAGKKVLPYRRMLLQYGEQLVMKHEGFGAVWDEVLSREIKADELEDIS